VDTPLLTLGVDELPGLRRLVFAPWFPHVPIDGDCTWLARSGLLAQLAELTLEGSTTGAGADALATALGGRKLARLELRTPEIAADVRARFAALCDELVCRDAAPTAPSEEWVEHVNKPEWGRGRVIRRFDDKLEIAFAAAGTKVLVASSPLLRPVKP